MKQGKITRRELMRRAGAAALGFTIVPRFVLGGKGYTPPSEQLTKAIIGVGGMGRGHITIPGSRLIAVCDVDRRHLAQALDKCKEEGIEGVKPYGDFRQLLAEVDADIIHIPTPPHWHALIAIAAANAGKDIWCEKPMTRTIAEGQAVVKAVQKNGRIFRINTHVRSGGGWYDAGTNADTIRKIIQSGILGSPVKLTIAQPTGFDWKLYWSGRTDLKPEPVPEELDYDFWLGPAPFKPYHNHRVHSSFRGYWDYDGGGLGDMGMHYLDPAQYVLDKDDTSPVEIEADAPIQHPDAVSSWKRIWMRYKDGDTLLLDADTRDPETPLLEGPKGKVFKDMRSTIPDFARIVAQLPEPPPKETDFHACVRTRRKYCLNEENGHRTCTIVNLAKIATRVQRPLRFDPEKQLFVNDPEANRLIDEPMRAPWHI